MENKHELYELKQWQSLPLNVKVAMTKERIREWVKEYGIDGVYVSFSGGKDSTVLLDIARQEYPQMVAVFVDTGLEYPEIKRFVKSFDNVEIIRPELTFKQVIDKYGYPIFSKETAEFVRKAKKNVKEGKLYTNRVKALKGELMDRDGVTPSLFNKPKYEFMLNAPFEISEQCCDVTKKKPAKEYNKRTGRKPITAMMACESLKRQRGWLKTGCNAFDLPLPTSNPMAFWTENDVLKYIKQNNIAIADVYGSVQETDLIGCNYCTTGLDRTGCMFCLFGIIQQKSPNRLEQMKITHPKQYEYIMKPREEGGLGYKDIIDWINENGNLNIKY